MHMEGSKTTNKRGRKKGQKKLPQRMCSENEGSDDDSECGRFEAKSSTKHSQSSVRRNEAERSSPFSSSKCSEASQQHLSKTTFQGQEQPIDERECHFECPCGKDCHNKHGFTRHLRDKHAYHLLSELYIPVRKTLANNGFFSDFFKEHKKVIQEIEKSPDIAFPVPEELKNRLSQTFVSQALRKYKEMGIMMEKPLFDLYEERHSDEQKSEVFLSTSVMLSLKKLTLKYLTEFQRHFTIFIKNISLSQLITLFLFNFAFNLQRHSNSFLTLPKMQLFEALMSDFESWVNQHYAKVFQLNRIFYNHIETESEYCKRERTWNISLLAQSYLEQQRKRAGLAFKPINFILLCFQEHLRAEELIE